MKMNRCGCNTILSTLTSSSSSSSSRPRPSSRRNRNRNSNSKSNLKLKSKLKKTLKSNEPAVYNYKGLEEVPKMVVHASIHPSVTEIDMYAFKGCSKLQSVIMARMPEATLAEAALAKVDAKVDAEVVADLDTDLNVDLNVDLDANANTNKKKKNKNDNIPIPIPSPKLTTIGRSAFGHCKSLISMQIPYGVTRIGENAFRDCISLTTVNVPPTVRSIGVCAFRYCTSLRVLDLPCSMEQIGIGAFYHCESLIAITMPSSLMAASTTNSSPNSSTSSPTSTMVSSSILSSTSEIEQTLSSSNSSSSLVLSSSILSSSSNSSSSLKPTLRIYPAAFRGCKNLILLSLPKSINVKFIEQSGGFDHVRYPYFSQCTLLQRGAQEAVIAEKAKAKTNAKALLLNHDGTTSSGRNHTNTSRVGGGLTERRRTGIVRVANNNNNNHEGERVGQEPDVNAWLQNRFDSLPFHQECYDQHTTLEKMQTVIKLHSKKNTLYGVDILGLNVLHVLACTHTDILYSNTKEQENKKQERIEMMKYVISLNPSLPYMDDKIYHMTPLQLFLKCNGIQFFYHHHHHRRQHNQKYLSQSLEKGLPWNIIELILVLDPESRLELGMEDDYTSLIPFLQAALLDKCDLDVVYNLVLESVEILLLMTMSGKRGGGKAEKGAKGLKSKKAIKSYSKRRKGGKGCEGFEE